MQKITTQGMRLLDELGREQIFHGINLKGDNRIDEAITWLDEDFFRRSKELGFRLLRLGIGWKDYEPEHGQYNEALLQKIDRLFDWAAKYDVYIFFDMHQDLYSAFADNVGNGAPAWATVTDGIKRGKTHFVWGEGYFWDRAVHRAFDNFWRNTPVDGKGLQDHFAALWQMLARRYGDHPALFGWDLLNEPHPGKVGGKVFRKLIAKLVRMCLISPKVHRIKFFKSVINKEKHGFMLDVLTPEMMHKITGAAYKTVYQFELEYYAPFVARMSKALREVTPNGIIVLEHNYFSNLGIPFNTKLPEWENSILYSPHGYDLTVDTPAYKYANNARVGYIFDQSRESQLRAGIPTMVGEWGGGGEGEGFFPHIEFLMNKFDSYNWSNTYFAYKKGFYDKPLIRVVSRPHPMAVNGEIKSFDVDSQNKIFTLNYTPGEGDLFTEIYLPNGYESVDAGEGAQIVLEGNVLKIKTKAGKIVVKYIDRERVQTEVE